MQKPNKPKKRVYLSHRRFAFANREEKARESLNKYREALEAYEKLYPFSPVRVEVGPELYDDLLITATKDSGRKAEKIYLDTLFGIKVVIDPSLRNGEIKFRYDE